MYEYEKTLQEKKIRLICGTDEAGRGPLAGPVVAGAVILNPDHLIEGLNDSKQLSAKTRELLAEEIKTHALAWGIGFVFEDEIDRINIYQASKLAMIKAVQAMGVEPEFILSDAMPLKETGVPHLPIVHGDALSASIAAASILAKTARDAFMEEMARKYPQYGFEIHKGYPTKQHLEALQKFGPCPIHRKTYGPVKNCFTEQMKLDLWGETTCH